MVQLCARGSLGVSARVHRPSARFLACPRCSHARKQLCAPAQAVSDRAEGDDGVDYAAVAAGLNKLLSSAKPGSGNSPLTGAVLRALVLEKWGRSYEVRLCRLQGKMYAQVMWKFLEQASFPLSELEYMEQLNAVAEYLNEWGAADTVRQGILAARRPPGYTGGTAARCVSIPLAVDLRGARSAEWM